MLRKSKIQALVVLLPWLSDAVPLPRQSVCKQPAERRGHSVHAAKFRCLRRHHQLALFDAFQKNFYTSKQFVDTSRLHRIIRGPRRDLLRYEKFP
jgi:hypothetical protein